MVSVNNIPWVCFGNVNLNW